MLKEALNPIKTEGLGRLIDSSDEDFLYHCSDKNIGYCLSLSNLMRLSYEQMIYIKEDLSATVEKGGSKAKEAEGILKAMYVQMGRVEHKISLLEKAIKEKSLTWLNQFQVI